MSTARRVGLSILLVAAGFITARAQTPTLRFELSTNARPASGRLFVIIGKTDRPEPRNTIGETGMNATPILARDVKNFGLGITAAVDRTAAIFPIESLDALPAGDYYVQALFDSNIDLKSVNAPGNLYSDIQRVHLDPRRGSTVKLELTKVIPPEQPPYGDPYQVNSDNNGPYGDAITQELIPHIERKFRVIPQPYARVLDGESTGGWVSLALKVFYPDFFNAVWSSCPDGVDFRGFQLIDIYEDKNAYVDDRGAERPSKRDINGKVEFTIRHECQMENVMGAGDSWTMSGQQWGAWNAAYGPRGRDGRPVPLWDPKSGGIAKSIIEHW